MNLPSFDLVDHLRKQRSFSEHTFGPGERTEGVVDHIRKELVEVLESRGQLEEWIDVVILAFDGAWRAGYSPMEIVRALVAKQAKNQGRKWPDWRLAEPGKAIEHIRAEEACSMITTPQAIDITVRSANGTYQTNTVRGMCASCTAGAGQAAQRLGEKLYGASLVRVEALPRCSDHNLTHWRLHAVPVHRQS